MFRDLVEGTQCYALKVGQVATFVCIAGYCLNYSFKFSFTILHCTVPMN